MFYRNQFSYLQSLQTTGLDYFKVNIGSITNENFPTYVFNFIEDTIEPSGDFTLKLLMSPLPSIILNAYSVSNFNNENVLSPNQVTFIQYANELIQNSQFDEVLKTIENSQYMLNLSGLSAVEKYPLTLGLELAISSYTYWQIAMGDTESPWYPYLSGSDLVRLNLKNYALQTLWGVLYGYNIGVANVQSIDTEARIGIHISALMGALSITPSRILFKDPQSPVINFSSSVSTDSFDCNN